VPRVEVVIKTKDGQSILLTEGDLIQKTVVIECCSQRCASRHGQELPQEVSLIDGQPMPAEGRQWLSLILPETSPQYTPMPPNFCSPSCVRDFLTYQYIAPSSAGVEAVQKTNNGSYPLAELNPEIPFPAASPEPIIIGQADGDSDDYRDPHAGMKFVGAGCDDGQWADVGDDR
jgi:hypothetical protein